MTNLSVRLLVVVGVLVLAAAALTRTSADAATKRATVLAQIAELRTETWHWQRLTMQPRTPTSYSERTTRSPAYRNWVRNLWRTRAERAQRRAENPPHRRQWLCIHRHERHPAQGWRTRTGNGFYGGLQMDISFQRSTALGCCSGRARRTAGRRSSRCGSPSGPIGAGAASIRGRTRPAPAA